MDDALTSKALKAAGVKTKREVVELGLKMLIQLVQQERIRQLRGKLNVSGWFRHMT